MKEYQVELKVCGMGGLFPYLVCAISKEEAITAATKRFGADFDCYRKCKIKIYNVMEV